MSHYLYRAYNTLPHYYGYQYLVPQPAAWLNYSVPFATPPGWFYEPHYFYPRNDFAAAATVPCESTHDNRFCPLGARVVDAPTVSPSRCLFPDRVQVTSASSLAQCQDPHTWPVASSHSLRS